MTTLQVKIIYGLKQIQEQFYQLQSFLDMSILIGLS